MPVVEVEVEKGRAVRGRVLEEEEGVCAAMDSRAGERPFLGVPDGCMKIKITTEKKLKH